MLDALLGRMLALPDIVLYLVVGAFAALENVVPPVPADVVALFGAFLAARGGASVLIAFLCVWIGNVAGALLVYGLGRVYGPRFFATPWGRFLLAPSQMAQLSNVYRRHGTAVILVSRFLPMFRALVPVFAGTSALGFWKTAVPLAVASGIWYGAIMYLGARAGSNWDAIRATVEGTGRWLFLAALLLALLLAWWWWRTREPSRGR